MSEHLSEFVQESEEQITELNNALLRLEEHPDDEEALENIFRIAHTLKGNCGAMGFESASDLAHAIEDLLDAVRAGRLAVTPELMDVVFDAVDRLESMIDEAAATGEIETDPADEIDAIRDRLATAGARTVEPPSDDEVDGLLSALEPSVAAGNDLYVARLAITPDEAGANGDRVVAALVDAFDLHGTDPSREAIVDDDYGDSFVAVFESAVGESAIASGLEPVEAVADFGLRAATDRLEVSGDEPAEDEASGGDVDAAADPDVDELLDSVDEYDDLDALVEEVDEDELEPFEEMGEAGSFEELLGEEASAAEQDSATTATDRNGEPASEGEAPPEDDADAGASDDVDDAGAVFDELKDEVETVGFDELQDELDDLEFDEFEEEEVGMDELLGEEGVDEADDAEAEADDGSDAGDAPETGDEPEQSITDEQSDADEETVVAFDESEPTEEATATGGDPAGGTTAPDDDPVEPTNAVGDATSFEEATVADADSDDGTEAVADADAGSGSNPSVAADSTPEEDGDAPAPLEDDGEPPFDVEDSEETPIDAENDESSSDGDVGADASFDEWDGDAEKWTPDAEPDESFAARADDDPAVADDESPLESTVDDEWTDEQEWDDDDEWTDEQEWDDDAEWDDEQWTDPDEGGEVEFDDLEDGDDPWTGEEPEVDESWSASGDWSVEEDWDGSEDDLEAADAFAADADAPIGASSDDAPSNDDGVSSATSSEGTDGADDLETDTDPLADADVGEEPLADASVDDDPLADASVDDDPLAVDDADEVPEPLEDVEPLDLADAESGDAFAEDFGDDVFDEFEVDDDLESVEAELDDGFALEEESPFDDASGFGAESTADADDADEEPVRIVDEPELEVPDVSIPEPRERPDDADRSDEVQSVRVDVDQLDSLMTLVEGLVTSRVRLRHALEAGEDRDAIAAELDDLAGLTTDLQETVMDVRLVPLRTVAGRLPRVVRDVAREQEKEVSLELRGEDVELDRQVLDRIGDPLTHLVRNAVDHGIEPPEERADAGKPEEGTVTVAAERASGRVRITVEDDGRGLDPDRLRSAAVDADLLSADEADELSAAEARQFAFHPGLTTTAEVTDVSGRGVGMDVVKRTIDDLGGSVEIDSEVGEGTRVTMTLPVTVAIDDVLFLEAGGEEFGVPAKMVRDVEPADAVTAADGDSVLPEEDGSRPVVRLDDALGTPRAVADGDGMVVRIREEVRSIALQCDHVHGQQEVVVKPFDGFLSDVPGLGGATVRGRGEVVNILDVTTL